jgi:hypothetical protein
MSNLNLPKCILCNKLCNNTSVLTLYLGHLDICDKCIADILTTNGNIDMLTDKTVNCSEFDDPDFDLINYIGSEHTVTRTISWIVKEDSDSDSDSVVEI